MTAPTACGHHWASGPGPHEHVCRRVSPDHRSHECGCSEIELRTNAYQVAGPLRHEASEASPLGRG